MTSELIAIIAVGVTLAGLQMAHSRSLRAEVAELRRGLADVDRRLARIEGALSWRSAPDPAEK